MSNSHVGRYVDTEKLVVTWLNWSVADGRAVTSLPSVIPTAGVLWVANVGGPLDWDEGRVRVDVQTLIPGAFGAATPLATEAHDAMGQLAGQTVNGQLINTVYCRNLPMRQFWSPEVERLIATYELCFPTF